MMTLTTTVHLYLGSNKIDETVLQCVWRYCSTVAEVPRGIDPVKTSVGFRSPISIGAKANIEVSAPDGMDSIYVVITLDSVYGCNGSAVHNAIIERLMFFYPGVPIVSQNDVTGTWRIGKPYVEEE